MKRFALVLIAVATALYSGSVVAQSTAPAPPTQGADLCSGLKHIASGAPDQFKRFDVGEVTMAGGTIVMPKTRQSSATLPGVTACRIFTATTGVFHSCYFPTVSAAGAVTQARGLTRSLGQCLGAKTAAQESKDDVYLVSAFVSDGLEYSVRVRPDTTIAVELRVRKR